MKKIKFGYNNHPNGISRWEGMGISPSLFLTEAEYYGAVNYEGDSYIVSKVTKDEYGRFPHLVGKFIVRPAIAKIFADRSGFILLDQEESPISKLYEAILNESQIRENISDINGVLKNCYDAQKAASSFDEIILAHTIDDVFYVTSIPHMVFEEQKQTLKNYGDYFSQIPEELLGGRSNRSR